MNQEPTEIVSDTPTKSKRTLTVWILGLLMLILVCYSYITILSRIVLYTDVVLQAPIDWIIFPLLKTTFVLVISVGLFRRWNWSRWAASAILAFFAISFLQSPYDEDAPSPIADAMEVPTDDSSYMAGVVLGRILFSGTLLAGSGSLLLTKLSKEYFKKGGSS